MLLAGLSGCAYAASGTALSSDVPAPTGGRDQVSEHICAQGGLATDAPPRARKPIEPTHLNVPDLEGGNRPPWRGSRLRIADSPRTFDDTCFQKTGSGKTIGKRHETN